MANYFTGIDIGTTAVRCVIGRVDEGEDAPTIIGTGRSANLGMRKGAIVTIPDVIAAVDAAVDAAEKTAGAKIQNAMVNINGVHIAGINSKGVIAVNTANKEITSEEIVRAEDAATVVQLPANREIIQVFSRGYRLDGQDNIRDPLGMTGVRLEVDAHVVTAATPAVRNLERVMEGVDIGYAHPVLASVASSRAVLGREQRENGVAIVDIGGGTTNMAVVEEGDLQHVAILPVGGINITNDLAIGLQTDLDVAERVKLEFAQLSGEAPKTKHAKVKIGSKEHEFEYADINDFVQARVEEILEMVDAELRKIDRSGKLPGGVVFVGGSSNIKGLADFAKQKLRLPVRIAQPSGFSGVTDSISSPEFTAVIGLMLQQFSEQDEPEQKRGGGFSLPSAPSGGKVGSIAKDIFQRFKP